MTINVKKGEVNSAIMVNRNRGRAVWAHFAQTSCGHFFQGLVLHKKRTYKMPIFCYF